MLHKSPAGVVQLHGQGRHRPRALGAGAAAAATTEVVAAMAHGSGGGTRAFKIERVEIGVRNISGAGLHR